MNFEFLRIKIREKFKTIGLFANAIGVTRVTVSNWLNGVQNPEEHRFLDIVNALEMSESEISQFLGEPSISVVFRKVGASMSTEDIVERSKDLADTFFKIDGSSYVMKGTLLKLAPPVEAVKVANHIRTLLGLDRNEPVRLNEMLIELKKFNVNVFFVPFQKIGITVPEQQTSHKEVAFTASKGDKIILFVDTKRTLDETNFDICHELAHIALDHKVTTKDEEKFCNKVAQELIYPAAFLKERLADLEPFLNASKYSWPTVVHRFSKFYSELDWSAKGLALSLCANGFIGENSHEYKRLMAVHVWYRKRIHSIEETYFASFDPTAYDSLTTFFDSTIFTDKDLYKPFLELREAACNGRLSPRRLSEILSIDSGDADELVRSWESEIGAEVDQDDERASSAAAK